MKTSLIDRAGSAALPLLAFLCFSLVTPPMATAQKADQANKVMPLIEMKDARLTDAIKNLARQAAINYILDPRVTDSFVGAGNGNDPMPLINLRWENMTGTQALDRLLTEQKLMMVTNPATTVGRIVFTNQNVKPVPASEIGSDTNRPMPLIQMEEASLPDAVNNLARAALVRASLDPSLPAPTSIPGHRPVSSFFVSLRWQNLTAKQALVALLDNYDLAIVNDPSSGTAKITAKPDAGTGQGGK